MNDLTVGSDVEHLVVAFYQAAFADPLIGPVFTEVATCQVRRSGDRACEATGWPHRRIDAAANAAQVRQRVRDTVPQGDEEHAPVQPDF